MLRFIYPHANLGLEANNMAQKTNDNIGPNGTHMSPGSGKMGPIPNFSTTPIRTCPAGVPCARKALKKDGTESRFPNCYAMRLYMCRPTVRDAWDANTAMCEAGRYEDILSDVLWYIDRRGSRYFRWFVGGDIPSEDFLHKVMIPAAQARPDVTFMSFTKNYAVLPRDASAVPSNLHIVMSVWKDFGPSEELKAIYPCEYYNDGSDDCRIPSDAVECSGHCTGCYVCFNLTAGNSVYIDKH